MCMGGGGGERERGATVPGHLSRLDLEAYLLPSLNREIWCFEARFFFTRITR